MQDLKQLSRDPNAAEKARRAERKADAEAGLRVIDAPTGNTAASGSTGGGGGFKKGGFKSSFAAVKGPPPSIAKKKNVLGDDDDEDEVQPTPKNRSGPAPMLARGGDSRDDVESDTDEEYSRDKAGGGYYNPRQPTDCFAGCGGHHKIKTTS